MQNSHMLIFSSAQCKHDIESPFETKEKKKKSQQKYSYHKTLKSWNSLWTCDNFFVLHSNVNSSVYRISECTVNDNTFKQSNEKRKEGNNEKGEMKSKILLHTNAWMNSLYVR